MIWLAPPRNTSERRDRALRPFRGPCCTRRPRLQGSRSPPASREIAAGMFVRFTVSSFAHRRPRSEKKNHATERSVTWRKVTRCKGRKVKDDFLPPFLRERSLLDTRPKSPRGVLAKRKMIPGCEHKCERRLTGGGREPRSGRKPSSGDRGEGAGASRAESKAGSDWTPCRRLAQGESKRKSRSIFGNLTGTKQMEQPRRNTAWETAAARHVSAQRST